MGRFQNLILIVIILASWRMRSLSAMEVFLDCPGRSGFNMFRRCCKSEDLPNGCECFDISWGSEFTNTLFRLPKCPASLGVEFHLYTRRNSDTSYLVKAHDDTLSSSPFQPDLPTKFLIHGFIDKGPNTWSTPMKDALLDHEDMNVIIVNWGAGAMNILYSQVAANIRVVGAVTAQLMRVMKTSQNVSLESIHLIGHSLGAHVCGMAGKEIWRLEGELVGRITGLDPAGPLFESCSKYARLDKEDASFVDVMHTDAETLLDSGYGIRDSIGHVDFYPNGGKHQPACPPEIGPAGIFTWLNLDVEMWQGGACSHVTCLVYFINSITQCTFLAPDGSAHCSMGYHTSPECRGDYYPKTTDQPPFC